MPLQGNLTKTGHTFGRWYENSASTGTGYQGGSSYTVTKDVTLFAKWTAITYTVTFNGNGATSGIPTAISQEYGNSITLPSMTRAGYTFGGWYENSASTGTGYPGGSSYTVTKDVTLFAKWTAIPYTVTFDGNSATSGIPTPISQEYGNSITLPSMTRTGYTFGGWYENSACTGTGYSGGSSYTVTKDVTLFAKWTVITYYTVTFNGNGYTGGNIPTPISQIVYGNSITLPYTGNMARSGGYVFGVWNTRSDGTGTSYASGTSYTVTSDVTLYAKWTTINGGTKLGSDDVIPAGAVAIPDFTTLCKIGKETAYPLSGTYVLTANIDASASRNMNGGKGFEPIGNDVSMFTGKFYGKGYTISGLYINRPNDRYVGLFGKISNSNALISGIHIIDAIVNGSDNVGGLVGDFVYSTSISKSSVSGGTIIGTAGYAIVGGLAGWIQGSTIADCYSTATVSGHIVGGLVGVNSSGATISRSYAAGVVNGNGGDEYVGGLAGGIFGNIANSYSASTVTSSASGGLVGNISPSFQYVTITNCYSVGNGSLVGSVSSSSSDKYSITITSSYWDTETSGTTISAGTGAIGKTTAQMKQRSTYTGWDFSSVWDIGNGYPYLRTLGAPPLLKAPVAANMMFKTTQPTAPTISNAEIERRTRAEAERIHAEYLRHMAER
jgi:uncharacterized repeat protein (TIGR02543 family)